MTQAAEAPPAQDIEPAAALVPDDPATWQPGTFVEHEGERFRLAERVSHMAVMEYAKVAERGADSGTLEGFTALFDLIRSVIDDRDWMRFRDYCNVLRLNDVEITQIATDAMGIITGRPSESPSASRGGPQSTSPSSNGTSGAAGSARKRRGARSGDDQARALKDELGIHPIDDDLG